MLINRFLAGGVSKWNKYKVAIVGDIVERTEEGYEVITAPSTYAASISVERSADIQSGEQIGYTYGPNTSTGSGYQKDVVSETIATYNSGELILNRLIVHKLSIHWSVASYRIRQTMYFEISGPAINRGDLIGTVTAADPNAYPVNGVHTDGYYYVKQ